ncbi:MAG: PhnD/SsuA/transferrin family substrate-binding protein [Pseudomonadota bacterium]|nr:PhnD/SsuA/transferrin family substrate-binding protein [Pseudomonadota bacterium]MDP1904955.1 PhnD/SsuA/transferrin family substrate-binding protein [Pseudomonadota bacterium]MDP2354324.1 PhnD/SsuA/transferrin family substrate-binding protein [Pseudomonadota bacterium]
MRRIIATLVILFTAVLTVNAHAREELLLNVTLDYDQERDHMGTQSVFNDLAKYLSGAIGQPVKLVMTQNAERVGERIRTNSFSMLLAPAQLVGLAMRNGYTPVAKTEANTGMVLVARKTANIKSLEDARGKRIALPHQESLVSYLFKGEMNALGLSPSSYFRRTMHMTQYGAVLYAMDIGQADLAAMKEDVARDWIARDKNAVMVKTFAQVPAAGVVVSDKLDAGVKDKIRSAFTRLDKDLEKRLTRVKFGAFDPADAIDFEHVATRGFYTPETLPGATIPTAEQVKQLMAQGAPLIDVRPLAHRRAGYIPGSISVPYELNSPKEVEYDDGVDRFDLSKLPQDKNAAMIFQCNGAECWFSYKAARYMVKRGFKRVYWFRTGLPAWKAAGYPTQQGS